MERGEAVRWAAGSITAASVGAVLFAGVVAVRFPLVGKDVASTTETVLLGISMLSWVGTGAVLALLRPRTPVGWLFLAIGGSGSLQMGLAAYGGYGLLVAEPAWPGAPWSAAAAAGAHLPAVFALPTVVLALYPDGRLAQRWLRWPVALAALAISALVLSSAFDPEAYDDIVPGGTPPLSRPGAVLDGVQATALVVVAVCTVLITGQAVLRLLRTQPPRRQQLAWMLCVMGVVIGSSFFVAPLVRSAMAVLVPIAVGIGVLRYRMLGIEAVLRRGLVYGALTAAVVCTYLLVTVALGGLWRPRGLSGVLAAALVAVGLAPVKERVQRSVDWWIYGSGRDPLRALALLGERVADSEERELLPAALLAVRAAVRAPAVAVTDGRGRTLASAGPAPAAGHVRELRLAGQHLGTLTVADRTPGDPYGRDDRNLLGALAQQVAVLVRALQLTEQLAAQRDDVREATRQERERLRHDLHDGLGPSLAGVGLGLQAASERLASGDLDAAGALLARIREETTGAVGEIRRIIEGLRPGVLDEVGLVEAVRGHARSLEPLVRIDVRVTGTPVRIPPRVEGAAYRILTEAMTNVVRHARASSATASLAFGERSLTLVVADDGTGDPGRFAAGVGLTSMRRRAEELGGSLGLASGNRGTVLTATLPWSASAHEGEGE
ncbi:GAF domain-containing sensor histidine kinase [Streptomyces sp. NPDC001941]|uniref:sensor histidine kinase n=1 Tax=Streptomyces sp. NPDC001941 TaxID=3154659 RepID=UPI0033278CE7